MRLKALITAAAAVSALAAPAAAEAHRNPDHRDVRSHVRAADRALDRVSRLVDAGDARAAEAALRGHRRHVRAAIREARVVLRRARGSRELRRAALAHRSLASGQATGVSEYTALLAGDVEGSLQERLARVLNASLAEREAVLDRLAGLVDELPAGSRAGVSTWLRQLTEDGHALVGSLLGLLGEVTFPVDVQQLMGRALDLATGAVDQAMARLEGLVGLLPAQAREPVRAAIEHVGAMMTMVRGMLETLVGSLPTVTPGQVAGLPDLSALLPGLQHVLPGLGGTFPSPQQLLANLTNVLPALQGLVPGIGQLPVGGVPDLSAILERVGRLVPGLSELLGGLAGQLGSAPVAGTGEGSTGGQVPGLIENLLGGLFGGRR